MEKKLYIVLFLLCVLSILNIILNIVIFTSVDYKSIRTALSDTLKEEAKVIYGE